MGLSTPRCYSGGYYSASILIYSNSGGSDV